LGGGSDEDDDSLSSGFTDLVGVFTEGDDQINLLAIPIDVTNIPARITKLEQSCTTLAGERKWLQWEKEHIVAEKLRLANLDEVVNNRKIDL
jgi:hypothetical protein